MIHGIEAIEKLLFLHQLFKCPHLHNLSLMHGQNAVILSQNRLMKSMCYIQYGGLFLYYQAHYNKLIFHL